MTDQYEPPKVWTWVSQSGDGVLALNRPVSGATHDADLPVGQHPFQLYSIASPNGQKATIMFEELLEQGHAGAEYDAWMMNIGEGIQFSSGFVAVNPNSKIPCMVDQSGAMPFRVFESGAMLLHLAEKFGAFIPTDPVGRAECLSWLFWQVGSAPSIGGGFGHFFGHAKAKVEYAINRYTLETKRLLHVADTRLKDSQYLAGDTYTIADIAAFPWFAGFQEDKSYKNAREFLSFDEYPHLIRWCKEIALRPAVIRGRRVNHWEADGVKDRHSAADFG